MTYRPATPDDVTRIAALHARSWQETYRGILPDSFLDNEVEAERLVVWQERLADNPANRQIILAEADGQLAGFACVFANDDPVHGALLDNLHVASAWKGHGVGRQLMKKAARWVQDQTPGSPFYLWVYADNSAARAFYDHLGGINHEAIPGEHALVLRYIWPDTESLRAADNQSR